MRMRPLLAALGLGTLLVAAIACRPTPSAQLDLPPESDPEIESSEPVARGSTPVAPVIVDAPPIGPELDWRAVDDRLTSVITAAGHPRIRVDYDANHPWFGASAPLVTVVVLYDYQCPYSSKLSEAFDQLLGEYPDTLRVVWRQFPLSTHPQARLAAKAALAAHSQGMFGPMHAWLFANNRSLTREAIDQQALVLGLDLARFRSDLDSDWIDQRIADDQSAATHVHVSSTPSWFVNGRPQRGAQQLESIRPLLDEELALANDLVAAGSGRLEVWARLLAAAEPNPAAPTRPASKPTPTPKSAGSNDRLAVDNSGLTRRGSKKAKVEILMCADFDCPFSAKSVATLAELDKQYGKKLAIFFRHMPLAMHANARPAHRAAIAADAQGELWSMWELLFANNKARTDAELEAFAAQLGLDVGAFQTAVADPKTEQQIEDDIATCTKLGASGTPTFFINGRPVTGAQPIESFEAIIDEELAGKGPPPAKKP